MASYAVQFAKSQTLGAGVADTVTLQWAGRRIAVQNRDATAVISVTLGGPNVAAPTALGDDTYTVAPNSTLLLPYPVVSMGQQVTVKLISAGAPAYSVMVLPELSVA